MAVELVFLDCVGALFILAFFFWSAAAGSFARTCDVRPWRPAAAAHSIVD